MKIISRETFERRLKRLFDESYQLMFDKVGMNVPDNEYDKHVDLVEPLEDFINAYRKQHPNA